MHVQASTSEDHGIAALTNKDLQIYSVGIPTGGVAEIRMASQEPERHVVATTIDATGMTAAQMYIAEQHFEGQIEVKLENVAKPLPYADAYFDYIYARLVLHYLPENALIASLRELYRVLRPAGRLFIVVRSTECDDATREGTNYNPDTHLTSCTTIDKTSGKTYSYSRFFHTKESISSYVSDAGFTIQHTIAYDEHLYVDFMRTQLSPHVDNVIELLAHK